MTNLEVDVRLSQWNRGVVTDVAKALKEKQKKMLSLNHDKEEEGKKKDRRRRRKAGHLEGGVIFLLLLVDDSQPEVDLVALLELGIHLQDSREGLFRVLK